LPDSAVIDVAGAEFSEELLRPDRLEVVDEELPQLEDVVPGVDFMKPFRSKITDKTKFGQI
jgi:hypothetical protein